MNNRPYMHQKKNDPKPLSEDQNNKPEASVERRQDNRHNEGHLNEKRELTPATLLMRKGLGILTILLIVYGLVFSSTVSQEKGAEEIVNRTSTIIDSGFVLQDVSEVTLNAQDFEVSNFEGGSARMLIWDFTGDSGDEIQIIVDGQIIRESHTLSPNVAAYHVPVPSVVTIQGLEGQANYAVKFPERRYAIFNTVSPGGTNSYTLTPNVLP